VRQILHAIDNPVVIATATGCLEVSTTVYPYSSWNVPWIHSAFENSSTTITGAEAAFKALKRRGKIPEDKNITFIAFGGDGASYDIGFQYISGALERGHNFIYVCLNNEAYMNTGVQRSSASPYGAHTTTSPSGSHSPGKKAFQKDLTAIMAAHDIPYVAQSISGRWRDLTAKAEKAFECGGPAFINVLTPCPLGWIADASESVNLAQLAADCCVWPLYEVENGVWKLTYKPKEKLPIDEYLKKQGRFKHLFKGAEGEAVRAKMQEYVDAKWELLKQKCGEA